MVRRLRALDVLVAALLCFITAFNNFAAAASQNVYRYAPSTENFPNPERGFFAQRAPLWFNASRNPETINSLTALRKQGISVVRWYFLIDEFRQTLLSADILDFINEQFSAARQAGVKVIPRFAYNFPTGGTYPYTDPDASLNIVLAHIQQLEPVFKNISDVIAFMELGFIGAWGEWHSSTNNLIDPAGHVNNASKSIVSALMRVLPVSRSLAMRYTPYKMELYGNDPLTLAESFSGSDKSRMGAHNDCFLASRTDWGTYPDDQHGRESLKNFLHQDNMFVPQGGETCNANIEARPFIQCSNAMKELQRMRWSALNLDYNEDVLNEWRRKSCFKSIALKLGYRFQLKSAQIPRAVVAGGFLRLKVTLKNLGYASPYNPRRVEIILQNRSSGKIIRHHVSSADPRRWLPDMGLIVLDVPNVGIYLNATLGVHDVYLNMPDPESKLYNRPEYSIRLANRNTWDFSTGFNRLGTVEVLPATST